LGVAVAAESLIKLFSLIKQPFITIIARAFTQSDPADRDALATGSKDGISGHWCRPSTSMK